jgi:hypothetical protein
MFHPFRLDLNELQRAKKMIKSSSARRNVDSMEKQNKARGKIKGKSIGNAP